MLRPLWLLLAVVFVFEGWLWDRLARLGERIANLIALPVLRARLAALIQRLPPPLALAVFLVPVLVLLPIKLLGLWMLARGSWLGALAVLALAKVLSVGVTAFLFRVTRPRLLQMAWFRAVHHRVLAVLGWAHRQLDPFKSAVRAWWRQAIARLAAGRPSSRWVRLLRRLRRQARRPGDLSGRV